MQYNDQVMGRAMGAGMASVGPLLFGRRTYEDFYSVWPKRKESPFSAVLDNADKYVASTTLAESLPWQNSTLLKGDASETVARLKKQAGKDILVMGSGELVRSLMRHNLVDIYKLLIHPLVLGSGRRLFPDFVRAKFALCGVRGAIAMRPPHFFPFMRNCHWPPSLCRLYLSSRRRHPDGERRPSTLAKAKRTAKDIAPGIPVRPRSGREHFSPKGRSSG